MAQLLLQGMEMMAAAFSKENLRRPVMTYAQILRNDQLKRMAKLGVIPSVFGAPTYHWEANHLQNRRKARAEQIHPVASTTAHGFPYTFHQTSPCYTPNMLETIGRAVNRRT